MSWQGWQFGELSSPGMSWYGERLVDRRNGDLEGNAPLRYNNVYFPRF
jgi:hypothetical protein